MNMQSRSFLKLLFRLFCFEPTPDTPGKLFNKYHLYCYYSTNLLFMLFQAFLIYMNQEKIFFTSDLVGKSVELALFFFSFFSYFFFQLEAIWYKSQYFKIFKEINRLEGFLKKYRRNVDETYKIFYKKYILKLTVFSGFTAITIISVFLAKFNETLTRNFWLAFVFQHCLQHIKQFQIIFYIDLIEFYFKILSNQFEELIEFSGYNEKSLKNSNYNKFLCKKLLLYKKNYNILYNITEKINEVMSYSLFFIIIVYYQKFLSDVYWFTFRILNSKMDILIRK